MALAEKAAVARDERETSVAEHRAALRRLGCPDGSLAALSSAFTPRLCAGSDAFMPPLYPTLVEADAVWRNALNAFDHPGVLRFRDVTSLAEKIGGFPGGSSYSVSFSFKREFSPSFSRHAHDAELYLSLLRFEESIHALSSPIFRGFVDECCADEAGRAVLHGYLKAFSEHLETGAVSPGAISRSSALRENIRERKRLAIAALTSPKALSGVENLKGMGAERAHAHFDMIAREGSELW
jgi:hypothetical protein